MFAKFLATLALVVLVAALFIGLGHPDMSGFQSVIDAFLNAFQGIGEYIAGVVKALVPSLDLGGVDPVWWVIAIIAGLFLLWKIWK